MRIYIFGNDGITLNREPPAAVSESLIELISRQTFDFPPQRWRACVGRG